MSRNVKTDEGLIEEGRKLVGTIEMSKLRLGRLALQFAPMGEPGVRSGAVARTEIYAEAVGIDPASLKRYRATAHAWAQFDVADREFSYTILKTLQPAGNKERALEVLRGEVPEGGWTTQTVLDMAKAEGLLPNRRGSGRRRPGTPETVLERLHNVNVTLGAVHLTDITLQRQDRERLQKLLKVALRELRRLNAEAGSGGANGSAKNGSARARNGRSTVAAS